MLSVLKPVFRWSLRLVLAGLVLLALLLVGVRVSFSLLPIFHERVVAYLNDQLDTDFVIDVLEPEWDGIRPSLTLRGLRLQAHEAEHPAFLVDRLDVELNTLASLANFTPIVDHLEADSISLSLESDRNDRWSLFGIRNMEDDSQSSKTFDVQAFLQWLSMQGYIDLTDIKLEMRPYEQLPLVFDTRYLSVSEEDGLKHLEWLLEFDNGSVLFEATGRGTRRWNSNWTGKLAANDIELSRVCLLLDDCGGILDHGKLNATATWGFQTGHWQVGGNLAVTELSYRLNGSTAPEPASLHTEFKALGYSQNNRVSDWGTELINTRVISGDNQALIENTEIRGHHQGETVINLAVKALELAPLKQLVLDAGVLPEFAADLTGTLNPTGTLRDITVRYLPERDPLADGSIVTKVRLDNVSVDAWGGAPSGGNVSGWLHMNTLSGYFDLETKSLRLGFPELFRDEWTFYSAEARLYWDVVDDIYRLKSDDIAVIGDEGWLNASMVLDVPFGHRSDQPLYLDVDVAIADGDARHAKQFIPVHILEQNLNDWLESAIIGATIHQGSFSIEGPLGSDSEEPLLWSLFLDVEDGEFAYDSDWPEVKGLKGRVFVDNDEVMVEAEQATTYDATLEQVRVNLDLDDELLKVYLTSKIQGHGEDIVRLLVDTPLAEYSDNVASDWTIKGDFSGDLSLMLPIEAIEDVDVKVALGTNNGFFAMPSPDIQLSHIKGNIAYDLESGFNASELEAQLLGEKITGSFASTIDYRGNETMQVDWQGRASIDALHNWLDLDFLSLLEGASDYTGSLIIKTGGPLTAQLSVKSELEGVEIELPAPLGITADEKNPLDIKLNAYRDKNELFVDLAGVGRTQFLFDSAFDFKSAVVNLGERGRLPDMKRGKILIAGVIPELDLAPWLEVFDGQPPNEDEINLLNQVEMDRVRIGHLIYEEHRWSDLTLNVKAGANYTEVTVNSEPIDGQLLIPSRPSLPYTLDMNRLHLPELPDSDDKDDAEDDILASLNPRDVPSAIVRVDSLKIGEANFGELSFIMQPIPDGKRISGIRAGDDGMMFTGSLDWLYIDEQHETRYNGALRGSEIETFQKSLGLPVMVDARDTRIDTTLEWQGSPMGINMSTMDGSLKLRLRDGSLKQLDGGAGALKLFGIFNAEAFLRRMRLDFSDLYSSGVSFDSLKGQLHFDKGIITFDEPLAVEGPSSNFRLDGQVNTTDEVMDLSLVVTLPVTSNLPILSVLLGTAPQVAGIIYLADKLVGRQVDQLASIRYRITGSFDEPSVTLDQLFSSRAKKPKAK